MIEKMTKQKFVSPHRYEQITDYFIEHVDEVMQMIADNNNKIPSQKFGELVGADGSACRGMIMGIVRTKMRLDK